MSEFVREEPESYWTPTTFRVAESFEEFVALNPDLKVEQNACGGLLSCRQPVVKVRAETWNHRAVASMVESFQRKDL